MPQPVATIPLTSTQNIPSGEGAAGGGDHSTAGTATRLPIKSADAVIATGDAFGIFWNSTPPTAMQMAVMIQTTCGTHRGMSLSGRSSGAAMVSAAPFAPDRTRKINPPDAMANPAHLRADTGDPRNIHESTSTSIGITA